VSDIAKEIVCSSSENESSDNEFNECGSLFSDSSTGENKANAHGIENASELPESRPTSINYKQSSRAPKLSKIDAKICMAVSVGKQASSASEPKAI